MNSKSAEPNRWRRLLWPGIGAVVLAGGTIYCHVTWMHRKGFIHGVPAFFLGLLALLIVGFLVQLGAAVWRRGRRWLISRDAMLLCGWTVLFAVSIITLFYVCERWRGKRAWAALAREARALGEPLEYEALIPPQPPDHLNFAKAPFFAPFFEKPPPPSLGYDLGKAFPELGGIERFATPPDRSRMPRASWLEGQETPLQKCLDFHFKTNRPTGQPRAAHRTKPTNNAAAAGLLLAAMAKESAILDELRQYGDRPECWFPLDQRLSGVMWSHQLSVMSGLMRVARLRASAELALGRTEAALADVQFGLRLADYGRRRPQTTSLVYVSHFRAVVDVLQPLWEGLARRSWTAGQLAGMQQQLEHLDLLGDYPNAVRADALSMAMFVEILLPTVRPTLARLTLENPDAERVRRLIRWIYPVGWSLQDQVAIHQFHLQATRDLFDLKTRRVVRGLDAGWRGLFTSSDPFFPIWLMPKLEQMAQESSEQFPFAQTVVDLASLACALERCRLAHGEFPATLADLVPQFIASLPHDLISGEPLKYRRAEGGFVLYSVGLNGTDEGGTLCVRENNWQGQPTAYFDLHTNDWVWLCPPMPRP